MAIETTYAITASIKDAVVLSRFNESGTSLLTWTEHTSLRMVVANGISDVAVGFGGCSAANMLFISTDQTITVKISGGTQAITVNSVMVLTADATALTISNASGASATVDILILD